VEVENLVHQGLGLPLADGGGKPSALAMEPRRGKGVELFSEVLYHIPRAQAKNNETASQYEAFIAHLLPVNPESASLYGPFRDWCRKNFRAGLVK
jgi:hypothetical protein